MISGERKTWPPIGFPLQKKIWRTQSTILTKKRYRNANNRAYYAIFHAISACLALEFKAFKSHAQVIGNFNKEYVFSGKFPKELGGKISRAQEVRNASDYSDFYIISVQETEVQLQTARQVVALVEKYLQAQ